MEEEKEAPKENEDKDNVQPPNDEQGEKEALDDKNPQAVVKKKTEIVREHEEPQDHDPYEPPSPAFDCRGTVSLLDLFNFIYSCTSTFLVKPKTLIHYSQILIMEGHIFEKLVVVGCD